MVVAILGEENRVEGWETKMEFKVIQGIITVTNSATIL